MRHFVPILALALVAGCGKVASKPAAAPAPVSNQVVVVDATQNGRDVRVEPGAKVELHPPKGGKWVIDPEFIADLKVTSASGQDGSQVFIVVVPRSGLYKLKLTRKLETFECTITCTLRI